jgi:hypothetical protein
MTARKQIDLLWIVLAFFLMGKVGWPATTNELGARVASSGWAKKRSIYPQDVGATICSALGIDWTKEITNTPSGRALQYVEFQSGTDFLDVSEIAELFG